MIIDPYMPFFAAFLLIFAIVLGLLTTAKLFTENKKVNAAIAIAFGLFAAMYDPFVEGVQTYLPYAAALLVVVFFFVLLKKIFGKSDDQKGGKYDAVPITVVLISLIGILISQWYRIQAFLPAELDPTSAAWVIGIAAILAIFWFAYKHNP